jgi:hypothetical protein
MRAKRLSSRPVHTPHGEEPRGDQAGMTVDWLGVQATGGGGASMLPLRLIGALSAIRAFPYLVQRAARRLAGRRD